MKSFFHKIKYGLISILDNYDSAIDNGVADTLPFRVNLIFYWVFFIISLINSKEAIYMLLEEYILENTKIKFYDDCIVADTVTQKEYIDNIIINLILKR